MDSLCHSEKLFSVKNISSFGSNVSIVQGCANSNFRIKIQFNPNSQNHNYIIIVM